MRPGVEIFLARSSGPIDELLVLRKRYIASRDDCLYLQKHADNREDARHWRDLAAEWIKLYRASCWFLKQFMSDPPGDCKSVDWHKDLDWYYESVAYEAEAVEDARA